MSAPAERPQGADQPYSPEDIARGMGVPLEWVGDAEWVHPTPAESPDAKQVRAVVGNMMKMPSRPPVLVLRDGAVDHLDGTWTPPGEPIEWDHDKRAQMPEDRRDG